jgi:rhodanese-related sulfurtransferase
LISYFKDSIITTSYNKVVLVCYSGQKTSYTAMLLRIIGYNNVYSLRWGMSSWDKNIANQYLYKNSSSSYISKLEKVNNKPVNTNKYPRILSDKVNAYDIILDKAQSLLDSGKFTISTEEVFANPSKYYIISYWPQIHYEKGHIAGAFQFEPFNSLTKDKQLSTLPIDKPILVYCYSGQQSATVAAYLRILGYDAYSLAFGANSFMLSTLKSGIGHVFGAEEIMNYPLVKGEKPSISSGNNINPSVTNGKTENNNITLPVKKKTKTQGGGC